VHIAKKLGVSTVSVSLWVRGLRKPRAEHLLKLTFLLNLPIEELVDW